LAVVTHRFCLYGRQSTAIGAGAMVLVRRRMNLSFRPAVLFRH